MVFVSDCAFFYMGNKGLTCNQGSSTCPLLLVLCGRRCVCLKRLMVHGGSGWLCPGTIAFIQAQDVSERCLLTLCRVCVCSRREVNEIDPTNVWKHVPRVQPSVLRRTPRPPRCGCYPPQILCRIVFPAQSTYKKGIMSIWACIYDDLAAPDFTNINRWKTHCDMCVCVCLRHWDWVMTMNLECVRPDFRAAHWWDLSWWTSFGSI